MSKLRAIQDRKIPNSMPNDLRGIGKSPLLTDLPPGPFLGISGAPAAELLKFQEGFQLKLKEQDGHLVLESRVEESYKHQGIRLWFAARKIMQAHPETRLHLGERILLREALLQNIEGSWVDPQELRQRPVTLNFETAGTLVVSPMQQLILVQVGFSLQAKDVDLVLQASDSLFHEKLPVKKSQSVASGY